MFNFAEENSSGSNAMIWCENIVSELPDNIFQANGFQRGMRKMARELVRSGGDTDLASLIDLHYNQ